ncbi:ATP-binding protein [uncultured Cetobacterium sp.]|uniref:sensor histidine kinase n=2 Tax=uncultured Cetobacterium sp. TaxID=527638 RepID=UPI00260606C1|nr:ATP-binding protein [uncultured Cetobacterium sp.]
MYKNSERSGIQIRRKEIMTLLFIILIEIFFVSLNIGYLSSLSKVEVKSTLKENVFIISNLIKEYKKDDYQQIFKGSDIRFNIINLNGDVVYDSTRFNKESLLENHGSREEVQVAIDNGQGFFIRKSTISKKTTAYYAVKRINKEGENVVIRVSKNYSPVITIIRIILLVEILFFTFLNISIHFFYKNFLKRDLYKKIEVIENFLKEKESGSALSFEKDPWILSFWRIVQKWQRKNLENIEKLNRDKRTLNQIIESIDSSLLLFDENLKLIIKNSKLSYLFEIDKDNYLELIKDIEIIELLKKILKNKKSFKTELYLSRVKRYFYICIKYLEEDKRYLLSIKDITQTKGVLEVQKTFISNVSHELKTPLTNIKGYVIALEDAPEPLKSQFIKTIKNNIDKLENIIIDFLNITKIEKSNIIKIEKVSVERLKAELAILLNERIKTSGAKITYNINLLDKNGNIKIDLEKVLTILKNLVENAIIYKGDKIPEIEISIIETRSKYKIGVKDNGLGMALEELNKIFERFYRVDKARTSNRAGTGLGLAIVKELIEKCGGQIDVLSKEGKGTIFIFTILK